MWQQCSIDCCNNLACNNSVQQINEIGTQYFADLHFTNMKSSTMWLNNLLNIAKLGKSGWQNNYNPKICTSVSLKPVNVCHIYDRRESGCIWKWGG